MRHLRLLLVAIFGWAMLLGWASQVMALDLPYNRPNPDRAALEQKLDGATAMPPGKIQGFTHLPDAKTGILVQPEGREFRDVRTRVQPWLDAALIVIAVGAMLALFLFAGPMRYRPDPAGRTIQRFTAFERFVHWTTAVSFVWLSLTGLNLVFGRHLLRPMIGDDPFATLSALLKLSHNAVGFSFIAGLAVMTVQWLTRNLPSRVDIAWLKELGGIFNGAHPPTGKFNAGQKMIYWIAVFGGGLISITGLLLLAPFYFLDIGGMQITHGVHSVAAALMIAVVIGHIYLGSVGVQGSFQAMATGRVDVNWAKTHHGLWVEEEMRKGQIPSDTLGSAHPAE